MTVPPLALVVLAAALHATWNLLAKRAAPAGAVFVLAYTAISVAAYAPAVAWLAFTGRLTASGAPTWPVAALIAASGALHILYSLALQRGYAAADLSVVYPVARGTSPLLSSMGAFLLLAETPTATGLAGLAAVVAGILLTATGGSFAAFRTPAGTAGLRWGMATGSMSAGYTVVDGFGIKSLGIAPVLLDWGGNLVRLAILAPLALRDPTRARAAMRGHWPRALGVGLLGPAAYILVLTALSMGAPLHVVAPTREISMMLGTLLGLWILREPVGSARLGGAALILSGVFLLARAG